MTGGASSANSSGLNAIASHGCFLCLALGSSPVVYEANHCRRSRDRLTSQGSAEKAAEKHRGAKKGLAQGPGGELVTVNQSPMVADGFDILCLLSLSKPVSGLHHDGL